MHNGKDSNKWPVDKLIEFLDVAVGSKRWKKMKDRGYP